MLRHRALVLAFATLVVLAGCDLSNPPPDTPAAKGPRLAVTSARSGGEAAFRIECDLVRTGKFDPIVYPGQDDVGHYHDFYGSDAIAPDMTDPTAEGSGSTCNGGTLNRSVYWVPSMIDISTWDPAAKTFERVPEMSGPYQRPLQVYYKAGYRGVPASSIEQWFPKGLRMIFGQPASSMSSGAPMDLSVSWWDCIANGNAQSIVGGMSKMGRIPEDCPPGAFVQGVVEAPQCWDGRNLDSPDHRSHMAYGLGWPDRGCPPSHPVPLPQVTIHVRWAVPAGGGEVMRLASDMYNGQPDGLSLHADEWFGWDPEVGQRVIDNCFQREADCGMHAIGPATPDGPWQELTEPTP